MDAKRGFVPEDERNFSPGALQLMRTASRHIRYLINEGYSRELVVTSDSIVLDHCTSWVNLTVQCLTKDNKSPLQVWE